MSKAKPFFLYNFNLKLENKENLMQLYESKGNYERDPTLPVRLRDVCPFQ